MSDSCGESTPRLVSGGAEAVHAVEHSQTEVLCRCAWCDGVFCDGGWRALTKARRVLQSVAGNPIGDASEHWVICPSCLERDFQELRFGMAA